MNMYARIAEYSAPTPTCAAGPAELSSFARRNAAPHRGTKFRLAGIIGVLAIHGLVLVAYVFGAASFVRVVPQHVMTVVNILAEPPKPLEPPPLPILAPPIVYVPVPIVPEIKLAVPPPPRDAITIPPAPANASPPDAPFVPPSPQPPPKPALSANAQAAFAGRLFAHLNKYKRYPEGAKLRHQEGVVSLRFTMDRVGHVLSFDIAKSSGSAALDAEARDLIQRAQPLPPLPTEFGRETLDLVVPVEFFLR
jgi:protein TonB